MKKRFISFISCLMILCCFCFVGCSDNKEPEINAFQSVKTICKNNTTRLNNYDDYNYYEVVVEQSEHQTYSIILFESKGEREDYIMFFCNSDYSTLNRSVFFKIYENNYKCYTLIMSYSNSLDESDFAVCEFEPSLITRQSEITDYETSRITDKEEPVEYNSAFIAILSLTKNYLSQQNIKLSEFGFTQFN